MPKELNPTLNKLIHLDQKGFIKNRFIEENIRISYDMIDYCKQKNIEESIVLADFEKAFDSIDRDFLSKTLKIFNFGTHIINWIKSLQIDSFTYIVQNGHNSRKVLLHIGCRQGDPVSLHVFVLVLVLVHAL